MKIYSLLLSLLVLACRPETNGHRESVSRGLDYFRVELTHPNVAHILEWDIENSDVTLATAMSGNVLRKTAPLSGLVRNITDSVIAAINGDFFSQENIPSGLFIKDGRPVKNSSPGWSAFGLSTKGEPFIEDAILVGHVSFPGRQTVLIDGFNRPRGDEEAIWYNSYFGKSTQTNVYGLELRLALENGNGRIGEDQTYRIREIDTSRGDNTLDDTTVVLSLHGQAKRALTARLVSAMTITTQIKIHPGPSSIRTAIGGFPVLVTDGREDSRVSEQTPFFLQRYARTAVGFSKDRKKVWFVCIDGAQPNYSVGMTMEELAQLMLGLGADRALNLDGGGSSTMIVQGQVVNRPSTGVERPIANALVLVRR